MKKKIALYIHWPFCESKCPYCGFNSHVHRTLDEREWVDAIIHEMKRNYERTSTQELVSIFFGGGTPSLLSAESVEKIISQALTLWSNENMAIEITLEANPSSVEAERFKGYATAGVNRLSLGVQSFNDQALQFLGRKHNSEHARNALKIAQNTFSRVSFDLIYARPEQTIAQWVEELQIALDFNTTHLSLYQLTIEPGTAFEPMHARGDLKIPEAKEAYELYEVTRQMMEGSGMHTYEISNYAKPGFESVHNLMYWTYQDYIGIGPGAHGRLHILDGGIFKKIATQQFKAPKTWYDHITQQQNGDKEVTPLNLETQFQEQIMMGLRLTKGIQYKDFLRPFTSQEEKKISYLSQEGLVQPHKTHFTLSNKGQLVLNSILNYLFADPN